MCSDQTCLIHAVMHVLRPRATLSYRSKWHVCGGRYDTHARNTHPQLGPSPSARLSHRLICLQNHLVQTHSQYRAEQQTQLPPDPLDAAMSWLPGFQAGVDADILFSGEDSRKLVEVKTADNKDRKETCPVYYDGESVKGQVGAVLCKKGPLIPFGSRR